MGAAMNLFPDRRQTLFGRTQELSQIKHLSEMAGVTFVSGRPQIGKSTLLIEAIRQLSQQHEPFLVGYTRCFGGDVFIRVVADLYARWLSDSTYLEQAKVVFEQQKVDFVGRYGEGIGTFFEKLSKVGGKPFEIMGSVALEGLKKLAEANRDLRTGRIALDPLAHDKARDLLLLVHRVARRRLVLVVDAWEKSQDVEDDALLLENLIQDIQEWPPCHVFVVHVPNDLTRSKESFLFKRYPGAVHRVSVQLMNLEWHTERDSLLSYIHELVPFTAAIEDEEVIGAIDGYPEVINRWARLRPTNPEDLLDIADAAHRSRFSELEDFRSYARNVRRFLMRFALLPGADDPITWTNLKPILMKDVEPNDIDQLKREGILEDVSPPSLGHSRRLEAALYTFSSSNRLELIDACEELIFDLAERVREVSIKCHSHIEHLAILGRTITDLDINPRNAILCQCALSLGAKVRLNPSEVSNFTNADLVEHPQVAPLLAMSLVNMLNSVQTDERKAWRDSLLECLITLGEMFPEDPRVAEELARGLLNVFHAWGLEENSPDRSMIAEELTDLADRWPGNVTVYCQVGKMYCSTLPDFDQLTEEFQGKEALDGLRELGDTFGSEPEIMVWVVRGILQVMAQLLSVAKLEDVKSLKEELFHYIRPLDHNISFLSQISSCVCEALYHAANIDSNLLAAEMLLPVLSTLNAVRPEGRDIRHNFARGLHIGIVSAAKYEWKLSWNFSQRALAALRSVLHKNESDLIVREEFLAGLACVTLDAIRSDNLTLVDELFEELEKLFQGSAIKIGMLNEYGRTLLNLVSYRDSKGDVQRRDDVLSRLSSLVKKYPESRETRVRFSKALYLLTINMAIAGELEKSRSLSTQHRRLVDEYEGDVEIRGHFVESLNYRMKTLGEPEASYLFDELIRLVDDYPAEAIVIELE